MIRSTFSGFEVAKRALNASQAGLDTVGHNIANVDTKGYTRQRVDQVSIGSTYRTKYQIYGNTARMAGQGVKLTGISQIRNTYLDTRYRNEASNYGELAMKSTGLNAVEDIFGELTTKGASHLLNEFIEELTKYQQTPDSTEYAITVRAAAQAMLQGLNTYSAQLDAALDQQKYDLDLSITHEVNTALEQIAYLNEKIRQANMYGDPANELNDARNMLIDQVSEYLPIKVVTTPEHISSDITISRVSIVLVNNSTSPAEEIMLVDNEKYNTLAMTEDSDGFVSIQLMEVATGLPLEDITKSITGGAIKGYVDIINGLGDFAGNGDNTYRGIHYYQKALDAFALKFAEMMNDLNSISTQEAAGKDYISVYENKNLFVSSDGGPITAANIRISEQWMNEPSYLTTTKEDPSEYTELTDEDGNFIYDDNGEKIWVATAQGDNLLRITEQLQASTHFYGYNNDGERFVLFRGTTNECLVSFQTSVGTDKKLNDSLLDASELVIETYIEQRASISAVSVDEEAISMMTYQNYYNAAARYMTTLDEALGTVIQSMGVVGR